MGKQVDYSAAMCVKCDSHMLHCTCDVPELVGVKDVVMNCYDGVVEYFGYLDGTERACCMCQTATNHAYRVLDAKDYEEIHKKVPPHLFKVRGDYYSPLCENCRGNILWGTPIEAMRDLFEERDRDDEDDCRAIAAVLKYRDGQGMSVPDLFEAIGLEIRDLAVKDLTDMAVMEQETLRDDIMQELRFLTGKLIAQEEKLNNIKFAVTILMNRRM